MQINSISSSLPEIANLPKLNDNNGDKFNNILTKFIGDVNQAQLNSNNITKEFIQGGNVQIQDVMIAGEQAKTSLQLLLEIRNRALDMYQELTRMQI